MTNPDNALGTNGAFGGRTSVNAFNDVLATFDGAGIVSGFAVAPDTGMTVEVGGSGTVRDVAVAEDPFGNRTTVDNISGDPIPVTIDTASTTSARIDSIVAYVNSPANASDTATDNPTACGIIAVNGTSGGAPLDTAIRTAITADGGTGSTAYYVVIANVSVPANTTTITSGLISAGKSINLTNVATSGSNGLMSGADKSKLDALGTDNYSLSEVETKMTWVDGSKIYKQTFYIPSLPNATDKEYSLGFTYNIRPVKMEGVMFNAGSNVSMQLPLAATNWVNFYIDETPHNIVITTTTDRRQFEAYITIYYIKTS